MSQDDFRRRIEVKQKSLEATKARLEALRTQFIGAAAKFCAEWWDDEASRLAKTEVAVTGALSDEQLCEMKADIKALREGAETHVKEFFSDSAAWWHLQKELKAMHIGESTYSYGAHGHGGPEQIVKPLRLVLGKLAPVVEKYGYLPGSQKGEREWREWDRSGNRKLPNGRPYYPYSLDWPKSLAPIIEQYNAQVNTAQQLLLEISSIELEEKQATAKKRWDSA